MPALESPPPPNSPLYSTTRSTQANRSPPLSPPPLPKRDRSEEASTRVEISFERFARVLLALPTTSSKSLKSALRKLSESIVASAGWQSLFDSYMDDITVEKPEPDAERLFVEVLNFITGERSKLELEGEATAPLVWGVDRSARPSFGSAVRPEPDIAHSAPSSVATFEIRTFPLSFSIYSVYSLLTLPNTGNAPHTMGVMRFGNDPPAFSWDNAAVVLEVHDQYASIRTRPVNPKTARKRQRPPSSTNLSRSLRRKTSAEAYSVPRSKSFAHFSTRGGEERSQFYDVEQKDEVDEDGVDAALHEERSSRDEDDFSDEDDFWDPPPPRLDEDLEEWAAEVFRASGNRRHLIGIQASGSDVRFYFYDRAGLIYTEALQLHLEEDAILFVGAVLSLSMISPLRLGLDPLFASTLRTPYHLNPGLPLPPSQPTSTWGSLTNPEGAMIRVDGVNFIVEDLIMSTGQLYGRGTTVFGIRPALFPTLLITPDETPLPHRRTSQTKDPARSSHRQLHQSLMPLNGRLILKLAWQVPSRQSEDELLILAQAKGVDGVVKLYKSATLERLSIGFRGRLVPKKMYIDRELRVQILGPRCIPLRHVSDIEDFKEAFRSLVRGQSLSRLPVYTSHKLTLLNLQRIMTFMKKRAFFIVTSVSETLWWTPTTTVEGS